MARDKTLTHKERVLETKNRIPEELQAPMRTRIRIARLAKRRTLHHNKSLSSGTIATWERYELSKARLGDLWAIADEWGIPFTEFMSYLLGSDVDNDVTGATHRSQRLHAYLNTMSEEMQELACNLVAQLVEYNANTLDHPASRGPRRNSRVINDANLAANARVE